MLNAIQCLISSLIIEKNIYNDHALVVFHQIITIAVRLYYYDILSYHTCIEFHKFHKLQSKL